MSLNELEVLGSEKPIGLSKLDQDLANSSVGGGFEDGNKDDDRVKNVTVEIPAKDLKPAQTGIKARDVIGIALDMLLSGEIGGDLGAIASSDSYIMDGHHRWAATYIIDPNAKLRVTLMDMPGEQLVTALNVITKGKLGIDVGNKEEGDIRSLNSHTLEPIIDSCIENGKPGNWPLTPEQVKQALSQVPGAGNYIQGKDVLLKNANLLPKDIMPNAPRRVDMPVIDQDKVDTAKTYLAKGSVDLKQPYSDKVATNISENIDDILTEWSYRIPKGYPTIVDGQFVDRDEVIILNQLLEERGLQTFSIQQESSAADASKLSSNPTDIKEALVCLFIDASLLEDSVIDLYRAGLDKNLDQKQRLKIVKTIKAKLNAVAKLYGKNYGISGYAKMGDFIAESLSDIKINKANIVTINNAVGAATAVIKQFNQIKPGMVHRDQLFNAIRAHAVKLIESNYGIRGYFPDNWCPGDIYIFLDISKAKKSLESKRLNVGEGSLNSYFYGTTNTRRPIIAISLKMQQAQAGKGTTFIKNVVVDGVTREDKMGKDIGNQQIIKLRDISRRLDKYYFSSDVWKKDKGVFTKVRQAVIQLSKMTKLPEIPSKSGEVKELTKYLITNKELIQKATNKVRNALGRSVDTATTFQQAYTRFVNNLKSLKIQKVEGNSGSFLKSIEAKNKQENKGKLDAGKMQALLSQKAATYDLASTLVEKWTEKTKKVSPAFADYLDKVKNPFVAITMFAIAQHGLNPNFYKAIGTNNASPGTISEFPSNSTVDEKKSVENLKVVDSPGQAGFYITYLLTINNHTYRTSLVFRFSKDQIRIEVEELAAV